MRDEQAELAAGALRRLRDCMSGMEAAPAARSAALAAFRASRRRRVPTVWTWAPAALAASIAVAALWLGPREAAVALPPIARLAPPVPPMRPNIAGQRERPPVQQAARRRAARKPDRAPVRPEPRESELATDFLPIPYAPPLDLAEGGQVIRVRLPRSAMNSLGLPVSGTGWRDRVPADVVVGGDGIARAVRFVRLSE